MAVAVDFDTASSAGSLKSRVHTGVRWLAVSNVVRQASSFLTTAILARLLAPADYGLMGMAVIVTSFALTLRDLGTSAAVVQRRHLPDHLLCTVFWANVSIGLVMMLTVMAAAPAVALFFREPRVTILLLALAPTLLLSSATAMHQALWQRDLLLSRPALIEVAAAVISSVVAILAAITGYGIWSLVFQLYANCLVQVLLLTLLAPWKPRLHFSLSDLRAVSRVALNTVGFNTVNYWARSLDNILVGRFLGPASLGYYSVAYRIMQYPLQAVSGLIGRVLFPTMAKLQDDSQLFRSVYLKTLGYISLFTFPAMIGLCVVTRPFVHTFLSARWEPVIVPLAILALVGGNQSIATNTGNIYMAKGRTDTMFRVGLLSSAIYLTGIIAGLKWGIVGVSIGYAIADAVATPIDYFFASRLLGASLHTLIAPTVRPLFCSVVMALSVLAATGPVLRSVGVVAGLVVLSAVGMLTYSVATWFFNRKQVLEFISVIGGVRA